MNETIRNGIIFELVLPLLDVPSVLKCSSLSTNLYHTINNDNLLWKKFCYQEEILPEEWDWQDNNTKWILGQPCRYKLYYMNCKRTAHNFRHNKRTKYKFRTYGDRVDYDGKTLILQYTAQSFQVYKVDNNTIIFFQNIDLPGKVFRVKTNTDYIVFLVKCANEYVIVYRLVDNVYEYFYTIHCDPSSGLSFKEGPIQYSEHKNTGIPQTFFHLFRNSLIIYYYNMERELNCRAMGIIERKIIQLSIREFANLKFDYNLIYTTNKFDNRIVVYDEKFVNIFNIDMNKVVNDDDINILEAFVNHKLLSIWFRDNQKSIRIIDFDKTNGKLYSPCKLLNIGYKYYSDSKIIKYLSSEIFIILYKYKKKPIIKGFRAANNELIWVITLFGGSEFKVFNKFQKFALGIGFNDVFDFKPMINDLDIYDCKTGKSLFSVHLGYYVSSFFVFNDMIVTFQQSRSATVKFYR